ncbi:MAG: hypothetical protein IPM64_00445 [Phycisphaerales bacterium]|nr:hypothetical protein [Phycisphaerales bacterium]
MCRPAPTSAGPLGGGSAAAALFDPTTVAGPDPDELALHLSLNAAAADVYFEGKARSREERDVVFSSAELGNAADGQTVRVAGRLFLDAVVVTYSRRSNPDLTDARLALRVNVVRVDKAGVSTTLFDGGVSVTGGANGQVSIVATGDIPAGRLIAGTNPAFQPAEFPVFAIAVIPPTTLDYEYDAVVGEPFTLIATVELDGATIPDGVGVTALVGSAPENLQAVVDASFGAGSGAALTQRISQERRTAAERVESAGGGPTRLCGLFGIEGLLLLALAGRPLLRRQGKGTQRRIARSVAT